MKKKLLIAICIILVFGVLGFSNSIPKSTYYIPDTPEAKEVMKAVEKAYDIEAEAAYTFDIKKFPVVFINDPRFPVSPGTLETVKELTSNPSLESVGWLDYKMALYSWRIEATLHAEKVKEKAKAENRALTIEESRSLIDSNGRIAPARAQGPIKNLPLTFLSVDINEDIATVTLDDGTYIADLTLVLVDGKWYIAAFKGISINV
jgi:hypothetical protein